MLPKQSELETWGFQDAPQMGQPHRHQLLGSKSSGGTMFVGCLRVKSSRILWPAGRWTAPVLHASTPPSSGHLPGRWAGRRSDRYNENLLVSQNTFLRIELLPHSILALPEIFWWKYVHLELLQPALQMNPDRWLQAEIGTRFWSPLYPTHLSLGLKLCRVDWCPA